MDLLTQKDILSFISAVVDQNGLMHHNIEAYSAFLDTGISGILTNHFNMSKDIVNKFKGTNAREQSIKTYNIKMNFSNVVVNTPKHSSFYKLGDETQLLFPYDARKNNLPYNGLITLTMNIIVTAIFENGNSESKEFSVDNVKIGNIPIMVGCTKCNTYNMTPTELKYKFEDPTDLGGMFIAKGTEWVIDQSENIRYNTPHVYKNMINSEKARCEFLSQPGGAFDNSSRIGVRLMESGKITIEINSVRFKNEQIPFYMIYKIFGMTSDLNIVKSIVYDLTRKDTNTIFMINALDKAFGEPMTLEETTLYCAERLLKMDIEKTYRENAEAKKYIINTFNMHLDDVLLPHMGRTAADRIKKLRFIGLLIRKVFLVHLNVIAESDRDNLSNKRMHGAGISIAKAFKTQFNNTAATSTLNTIIKTLSETSFDKFDQKAVTRCISAAVKPHDLTKALEQCITTANKDIVSGNKNMINRVQSQQLERKNPLNTIAALRTLTGSNSSNKTTARADEMRRVHPSYPGYICVVQSADSGEKVGLKKQLAITAGICSMGDAVLLKDKLRNDVIQLIDICDENILIYNNVFVNGEWIGCCENAWILAEKYRQMRRNLEIDRFTTICVDCVTSELHFWADVGRLFRPALIVYNNLLDFNAGKAEEFEQYTRFSLADVEGIYSGKITLDDLIKSGAAEYITPEEAENCLFAPSIVDLNKNQNNILYQYTHCEVEQAIFGLAGLMSPYGNFTKPDRITMATCQLKQAAGFYCYNFPYRYDKNRFFQFNNELPIINTFAHRYVPPSGVNVIIAYTNYMGENQEDSVVVNSASADRGLFSGIFFRVEYAELEQNWTYTVPDATVNKYKKNSKYDKLQANGLIAAGMTVNEGDIIIGIVQKNMKDQTFEDKSVTYNYTESAIVVESLFASGPNDEKIAIVKLKYFRKLIVGDKMCMTPDHSVLVSTGWKPIGLVTEDDYVYCDKNVYRRCTGIHAYEVDETLLYVPELNSHVTKNHKMYVSQNGTDFSLIEAGKLSGTVFHKNETGVIMTSAPYVEVRYKGPVYCITTATGKFYCKTTIPHWTGNSSRCGNKSIVARCVRESDMPFTEDGLTPDLIINPQSFTNRMAIGQVIEALCGNVAAMTGAIMDGTTFMPFDPYCIQEELVRLGLRPNGKRTMRNGITGEYIDTAIFICPTFEERLQKFVVDDEQFVGKYAPIDPITGQPTGGAIISSPRQGELEVWNFSSQGLMHVLKEKIFTDSDGINIYVCINCKNMAVYSKFNNRYLCSSCKDMADIVTVPSCRAAVVLLQYLNSSNIQVDLEVEPYYF